MTALTLSTTTPKPGETITLTCSGYAAGESRTVAILLDGVEVDRFTTRSATATRQLKAPASGSHRIDANGMRGCAAALFTVQAVVVPPVDPPASGVPSIPAGLGSLFRWVPAENGNVLGAMKVRTYPDDHIGGSGQHMTVFNRFRHTRVPVVANGYVELLAKRNGRTATNPLLIAQGDNKAYPLFDADLITSSENGVGPQFSYATYRFWLRFSTERCHWPAGWLLNLFWGMAGRTGYEIDGPEVLEGKDMILGVIGPGAGRKSLPKPADLATAFHEFKIVRSSSGVSMSIDGDLKATIAGAVRNEPMAVLLDTKIGFTWAEKPDDSTKDAFLHCAGITVDA